MIKKNEVFIWTDGACSGNPGKGGWGAHIKFHDSIREISGRENLTTNNKMELTAVIRALEYINAKSTINIYTDSEYVKNGITIWLNNWKKNNWRTSSNKNVKNRDLWEQLELISKKHDISWNWVKGHSGNQENERADYLARKAINTE